jgi:putative Mg2+ transporter-C (MgtC) family protein
MLVNIKKLASHEGLKFQQLTIKKEEDFFIIYLSFQASEEKEQKYNQSLFDLADVLEIKIE